MHRNSNRNPLVTLLILAVVTLLIVVVAVQLGISINTEYCFETPPSSGLGGGYDCVQWE